MKLQEAIKTLTEYQKWRLGNDDIPSPIPKVITEALDVLLNYHMVDDTQTIEKPQTLTSLWGLMKDRTCTNSCSVVCGECQIFNISDDCEEVNNWDSFVEEKNKELFAEEYANGKSSSEVFRDAHKKDFIAGYNKAKETPTSSQTEISDEEIKEAAKDYHRNNGVYYGQEKTFIDAIKWYREQLKKK